MDSRSYIHRSKHALENHFEGSEISSIKETLALPVVSSQKSRLKRQADGEDKGGNTNQVGGSKDPFIAEYCNDLAKVCKEVPTSIPLVICLLKCSISFFPNLKPFLSVFPYMTQFLCQGTGTLFVDVPLQLKKGGLKSTLAKTFLRQYHVQQSHRAEFSKSSARALPVTMIKNCEGQDFDEFKMLVKNLEIRDSTDKQGDTRGELTAISNIGSGMYLNGKCRKANLDGNTVALASIMEKWPCLSDILLPGFFVFSRAPAVASTNRISKLLRAWMMPVYIFTSIKCCIMPYADEKKKYECAHPIDILEKPHGLAETDGYIPVSKVCGVIPGVGTSLGAGE